MSSIQASALGRMALLYAEILPCASSKVRPAMKGHGDEVVPILH